MNDAPEAMGEMPEGKRQPAPYIRLPWYVVASGLVLLLGGLLALGLNANRSLRPQPVETPPPTAPILAYATPAPPVALTPTPAPARPTPAPTP